MSNMSYCRWQNTSKDVIDCGGDLEDRMNNPDDSEPLSREEREARESMFETMSLMFEALGVDVDLDAALEALKEIE